MTDGKKAHMNAKYWKELLMEWSQTMIRDRDFLPNGISADSIAAGWLGFPGATEEQINATESRLETPLPPSYREFLKVTNGWRQLTSYIMRLRSIEDVEWFATSNADWIKAYQESYANALPVSDQEYFIYGPEQYPPCFRPRYLSAALEISEDTMVSGAVYLLNPEVVTPDGEWEAWLFANWLPGAMRYRSFWDLMEEEYERFLASQE